MWSPLIKIPTNASPRILFSTAVGARRYQQGILIIIAVLILAIVTIFTDTQRLKDDYSVKLFDFAKSWQVSENVSQQPATSQKTLNRKFPSVSRQFKPPSKKTACKKWNLVACALIENEVQYLPEWIEFHRLQGVNHFVFYTHSSTDLPEYLPLLYESAGIKNLIDIIPARFFSQGIASNRSSVNFDQIKELSRIDCTARYKRDSQWILLTDVGHFVYRPDSGTIREFLSDREVIESEDPAIGIRVQNIGSSGNRSHFGTWLTSNVYTGSAELLYDTPNGASLLYPLVIEVGFSGVHVEECPEKVCASNVVLVKSDRCVAKNVTECIRPSKNVISPAEGPLRANNYNWKKSGIDSKPDITQGEGKPWEDTAKFVQPLRDGISKLKPRPFYSLDSDRSCDDRALASGQQIACPASHPYPFGNKGIDWMHRCCKTDHDWAGKPLTIHSDSCFKDAAINCPDHPTLPKWGLRSCCKFDIKARVTKQEAPVVAGLPIGALS